jgi:hypothetical protein
MEQKIFSKLNLYDQMGYLMVGSIALLLYALNSAYFFNVPLPAFNVDSFLIWFIFTYFIGHLIQGIANLINGIPLINFIIRENKQEYDEQDIEILNRAKEYFGLEKQDNNSLWNLCYLLSSAKDITGQIQTFNAFYGLYRGWLVVFIFQSIFLFYRLFVHFSLLILLYFLFSLLISYIFYSRAGRFWKYIKVKVLQNFVILQTAKL